MTVFKRAIVINASSIYVLGVDVSSHVMDVMITSAITVKSVYATILIILTAQLVVKVDVMSVPIVGKKGLTIDLPIDDFRNES